MLKILIVLIGLISCSSSKANLKNADDIRKSKKSTFLAPGYYKLVLPDNYKEKFIENFIKDFFEQSFEEEDRLRFKKLKDSMNSFVLEDKYLEKLNKDHDLESLASLDEFIKFYSKFFLEMSNKENIPITDILKMNILLKVHKNKIGDVLLEAYESSSKTLDEIIEIQKENKKSRRIAKNFSHFSHYEHSLWDHIGKLSQDRKNIEFDKRNQEENQQIINFKDGIFYLLNVPMKLEIVKIYGNNENNNSKIKEENIKPTSLSPGYYKLFLPSFYEYKLLYSILSRGYINKEKIFDFEELKNLFKDEEGYIYKKIKKLDREDELKDIKSLEKLVELYNAVISKEAFEENISFLEQVDMNYILKVYKSKLGDMIVEISQDDYEIIQEILNIRKKDFDSWKYIGKLSKDGKNLEFDKKSDNEIKKMLKFKDGLIYLLDVPVKLDLIKNYDDSNKDKSSNFKKDVQLKSLNSGYYELILPTELENKFMENFMKYMKEEDIKNIKSHYGEHLNYSEKINEEKYLEDMLKIEGYEANIRRLFKNKESSGYKKLKKLGKESEIKDIESLENLTKLNLILTSGEAFKKGISIFNELNLNYILKVYRNDQGDIVIESSKGMNKTLQEILNMRKIDYKSWSSIGKWDKDGKEIKSDKDEDLKEIKFKDGIFYLLDTPVKLREIKTY